jgi:transcriptional regulator with XRE-family HTH domain
MNTIDMKAEVDQRERVLMGQRLQDARKYLGFTQEEVAQFLGVQRTALVEMEKGNRKIEAVELKKISKLYEQPIAHFAGEDASTSALPADVAHLARKAASLSGSDREELARFADFLKSRSS